MRGLSLCSGYGGIEMGLHITFGETYETIAYCEREEHPASILKARMEDGSFPEVPIHPNMETFPCEEYAGQIDIICAGIPCQPYSIAGARKGNEDERALWPIFADIVQRVQPKAILLENVPAFLTHAEGIYNELRELGFNWYPPCFTNATFWGAPHRRKRVFLLAEHQDHVGYLQKNLLFNRGDASGNSPNPNCDGHRTSQEPNGRRVRSACGSVGAVWIANPENRTIRPQHQDAGYWDGQSPVCGVDDGSPARLEQLKLLGNGVVPIMVAGAISKLIRDGFVEPTEEFEQSRLFE